jgi:hypothetical protein
MRAVFPKFNIQRESRQVYITRDTAKLPDPQYSEDAVLKLPAEQFTPGYRRSG